MDTEPRHAEQLNLTENAVAVLKKRYLKKNEAGEPIEEPIDMFRHVAGAVAEAEVDFGMARGLTGDEARPSSRRPRRVSSTSCSPGNSCPTPPP